MSLLVIGALHWDVVVATSRLPRLDETLRGTSVDYRFGGKGGNQALAAARAGAKVAFAGRVGTDAPGAAMRTALETAGVATDALQTGPGTSGMSVAIETEGGAYGAVIVSAENHAFDPAALRFADGCAMVLLQNELAPGLNPTLAKAARAAGVHVMLNAAPAIGLGAADLAHVDTLVVNRVEGADLLGRAVDAQSPQETLAALQALVPKARILLTLGGGGVIFAEPGGAATHLPALPVTVRSTHGAGDVFVGALAAMLLRDRPLPKAVQAGQDAAARHISQIR